MTGTAKQIAWAEDIKKNIENTMSIMIANSNGDTSNAEALAAKMMANMDAEDAGNIINDFKDYKFKAYVDPEEEIEKAHWASEEIKAQYRDNEIARYERENAEKAVANYRLINEALVAAQQAGRNYIG